MTTSISWTGLVPGCTPPRLKCRKARREILLRHSLESGCIEGAFKLADAPIYQELSEMLLLWSMQTMATTGSYEAGSHKNLHGSVKHFLEVTFLFDVSHFLQFLSVIDRCPLPGFVRYSYANMGEKRLWTKSPNKRHSCSLHVWLPQLLKMYEDHTLVPNLFIYIFSGTQPVLVYPSTPT